MMELQLGLSHSKYIFSFNSVEKSDKKLAKLCFTLEHDFRTFEFFLNVFTEMI